MIFVQYRYRFHLKKTDKSVKLSAVTILIGGFKSYRCSAYLISAIHPHNSGGFFPIPQFLGRMAEESSHLKIKPDLEDARPNMDAEVGNTETHLTAPEPTAQDYIQPESLSDTPNTISIESDPSHSHSLSFVLPSYISFNEHIRSILRPHLAPVLHIYKNKMPQRILTYTPNKHLDPPNLFLNT